MNSRSELIWNLAPCSGLIPHCSMILEITDSKVEFGLIAHDHWFQPDWIDEKKASESRTQMIKDQVIYGGMCFYTSADSAADILNRECAVCKFLAV